MNKKEKIEWDYYIDKRTGRRCFNRICRKCKNDCKQSFRAIIVNCPNYKSKRAKERGEARNEATTF